MKTTTKLDFQVNSNIFFNVIMYAMRLEPTRFNNDLMRLLLNTRDWQEEYINCNYLLRLRVARAPGPFYDQSQVIQKPGSEERVRISFQNNVSIMKRGQLPWQLCIAGPSTSLVLCWVMLPELRQLAAAAWSVRAAERTVRQLGPDQRENNTQDGTN